MLFDLSLVLQVVYSVVFSVALLFIYNTQESHFVLDTGFSRTQGEKTNCQVQLV